MPFEVAVLRSFQWLFAFLLLGSLPIAGTVAAEKPAEQKSKSTASVFDGPRIDAKRQALMSAVMQLVSAGRMADAEKILQKALEDNDLPPAENHYNLACVFCSQGNKDAAIQSLAAAVKAGFDNPQVLDQDPDLHPIRALPRFETLSLDVLKRFQQKQANRKKAGSPMPTPRRVQNGVAEVTEENVAWVSQIGRFVVMHEFAKADSAAAISTEQGAVGDLLREWQKEGTAAGLHGFLYDNHDNDHSNMDYAKFPQLTRVEYCESAKQEHGVGMYGLSDLHAGLQVLFIHNAPLIGNSSMANVDPVAWRSITRQAMQTLQTMTLMADQYVNNQLYFYPEHRDHDPDSVSGFGDTFTANVPYTLTSQGSSGSDRDFLNAIACTMAAFRPDTQRFLLEQKLLIPTVQMIFRTCRKPIQNRDDYLTGKAHPVVFDGATLDVERMVRMAHDLKPGDVPPLVKLKVTSQDEGRPGIDYFERGPAERLFDTVSAVARVARSARQRRQMVVSVAETQDPNGHPLTFIWKLLRGDAARVKIRPLDEKGTAAELLVDWHPRGVYPGGDLPCSRVDIGVFANNGTHVSAPAMVTWYFPANERRTYEDVPATADANRQDALNGDSPKRIVSIQRLPPNAVESYVDPLVVTPATWTDTYHYNDRGDLLGWTRSIDGRTEDFTRDGAIVTTSDDAKRPVMARTMLYIREQKSQKEWPILREVLGPELIQYRYDSPADSLGTIDGRRPAAAAPVGPKSPSPAPPREGSQ